MANFWSDKRVLITGGAGYIGSNLAARLLAEGARMLRAVDNLERGQQEYLRPCLGQPNFEFQQADLRQAASAITACADIDVVFHLASKVGGIGYHLKQPGTVFLDNTLIDHNVWSAALALQVPFYLYASSAHIYPIDAQLSPDAQAIREDMAYP